MLEEECQARHINKFHGNQSINQPINPKFNILNDKLCQPQVEYQITSNAEASHLILLLVEHPEQITIFQSLCLVTAFFNIVKIAHMRFRRVMNKL
ncbi:CLUMA_CG011425, isoform A [Clunio marinus]|uniref:CLUMA_CG011425, isoform A n=1 Tax=Clunio marinus TaxID=568069 RepID=A0A1J1ICU3_9DIPT|nr:CLUMA_CG011425, isoform A [Clunio marinus]